ncbi:MAG: beta-galactosidase [Firmicutes bacterium]|nr:beta-galactosidase [Bacillota bacterium]
MSSFGKPYYGAAYYPEDWPLEQIDDDIALMKDAGMNVMRIGEFAWSRMEPVEGQYDFDWLHLVVNKLGEAGIKVIMGTPTCTPPIWVAQNYPECIVVDENGVRAQHGARRHACPNSPMYRELSRRIVTAMAKEFGHDRNIIGWQIDNELFLLGRRGCCCPECHRKFQLQLRERYGSIEKLNEAWGLNLWSQAYSSFADIPIPKTSIWHHPSLITAWMDFQSDSYVEFCAMQADIIHELTIHPVGTDMMPTGGINYAKIHKNLDLVQFNHYWPPERLNNVPFWYDYIRTICDRPFWNTETSTCWNGSTTANGYKETGFCTANSWLPIALGGEACLYWLWRSHWAGHELMHGSVVSSAGRPLHIIDEVREISRGFEVSSEFLNTTQIKKPKLALHFSCFEWLLLAAQPMVREFKYLDQLLDCFYTPLIESQLRLDVIDPSALLDDYDVVISPFIAALDESGLRERLKKWIEEGGTWIAGPLTDNRTMDCTKFTHSPFGSLEDWGGVYCKYQIPGDPRDFGVRYPCGREATGKVWYDGFELRGADSIAEYTEGPLSGLSAITVKKMGKGQVVLLGTVPDPQSLVTLVTQVGSPDATTPYVQASSNVLVVPRSGDGGEGAVVVELRNTSGRLSLPHRFIDLLSGRTLEGEVEVPGYSVMVLKRLD